MRIWRNIVITLVILAGIGVLRVPMLHAVNASFTTTARLVNSAGVVFDGGFASATSASPNITARVVNSAGKVMDSFATSFCMGTSPSIAANTTDFVACGENATHSLITTEANGQVLIPAVCTISNLSVKVTTAVAAGKNPIITVDKATVGTALTCTVGDGATACTDVAHSFATAAGDLLSISLANPLGANGTGVVYIAFQINC